MLQLPEVKPRLIDLGAAPASTTPEQFLEFIRRDNAKWAKLIKEPGIVVDAAKQSGNDPPQCRYFTLIVLAIFMIYIMIIPIFRV